MIRLTETAAKKVKQQLAKRGHGIGLRVGIRTTGCSGLAYVLEYVDALQPDDQIFESLDCKIVVDSKSIVYINGLVIDYKRNGLNEGFEFSNPNERDRCGCGESFRV